MNCCSAYDSLHANYIEENCRIAFGAAARVGVPRLLDPQDMVSRQQPDKLAVMTYVYQLRMILDCASNKNSTSDSHAVEDDKHNLNTHKNDADEHALINNHTTAVVDDADGVLDQERKNSYRYFTSALSPISESSKALLSSSFSLSSSSSAASPQHKVSGGTNNVAVISPLHNNVSPLKASPLIRTAAATAVPNVGRAAHLADFSRPTTSNNSADDRRNYEGLKAGYETAVTQSERHDRARRLVMQNQQFLSPTQQPVSSPSKMQKNSHPTASASVEKGQPYFPTAVTTRQREDELRARARQMIQAFKHGRYREIQHQQSRRSLDNNSLPAALFVPPSSSSSRLLPSLPQQHYQVDGNGALRSARHSALSSGSTANIESPLQRFRTTVGKHVSVE